MAAPVSTKHSVCSSVVSCLSFKCQLEAHWGFEMMYHVFLYLTGLNSYKLSKFEINKSSIFV